MKLTKWTSHKPVDNRDPGFALPGYQLRWLGSSVHERRSGRIWEVLQISMLPDDLVKHLKRTQPFWFRDSNGDTIRRRGDVLAYAPIEAVMEVRKENQREAQEKLSIFRRGKNKMSNDEMKERAGEVIIESSMEKISFGKEDFQ